MENKCAINTVTNKRQVIADIEHFRKKNSDLQNSLTLIPSQCLGQVSWERFYNLGGNTLIQNTINYKAQSEVV